jgi:O-antigen biosynthesis protein WbqP
MTPILLLAGLMIIIEDGMPILFIQERLGENSKIFKIIKIRTLKNSVPNIGTHELQEKHLLKIGKLLRKIKIDEFPQLFNVLRGELNIVGPRPGLPTQTDLKQERFVKNVFTVKPGITGLAQILGFDMRNPEKLSEIDAIYIANKSISIDLLIIFGTFFKAPGKYLKLKLKI